MARLPSNSIQEFQAALKMARNIIIVTGAGLSAASGIPTFRGAGGMWRSLDAKSLATPEAFEENPSLVWQFYHYRREKALQCQPNAAHIVLAKLAIPSILEKVAPAAKSFHLITQNVDGLSPRILQQIESIQKAKEPPVSEKDLPDSSTLIEMHGRLFDVICTQCEHSVFDVSSPLCPGLGEADRKHADIIAAGMKENEIKIPIEELPKCIKCGSLTRPGVVWFGEEIPLLPAIEEIVAKADLCLVVGTSSTVFPASTFASEVKERTDGKGIVAVFNLENTERKGVADFVFIGGCETELPKAVGIDASLDL
ncbi:DHS-like NAD/FAD-binding domain-containing protein [Serendipita vermifera]|nr:DHS-like NAD/FAD-binding domain-containing protein [Serendipita vermifera]